MIILWIFVFPIYGAEFKNGATPYEDLLHIDDLPNVAGFGDAENRGPMWEEEEMTQGSKETDSYADSENTASSTSEETSISRSKSESTDASSFETEEQKIASRVYRTCTPCPEDMMKKHKNMGIKWICGGYQRARRSFKSICMMRYRNCQDGTLFVKLYDQQCNNDSYYGRHWFYEYRV